MNELSVFYRMLGIAKNVIEPSYYHLLGLERKGFRADDVAGALLDRKKELRQNVPGPEFIPLVLKFELEQLEPAAAVLGDEAKRRAYDEELGGSGKGEIESEKGGLVVAVRQAILEAVDVNGTLDESGRVALAGKLRALEVGEYNISVILERIPAAVESSGEQGQKLNEFFEGAVLLAAAEGQIAEGEVAKLYKLSERLGIERDEASAVIVKMGGAAVSAGVEVELVRPVLEAKQRQAEQAAKVKRAKENEAIEKSVGVEIIADDEDEIEAVDGLLEVVLRYLVPFIVLLVFTFAAFFVLEMREAKDADVPNEPVKEVEVVAESQGEKEVASVEIQKSRAAKVSQEIEAVVEQISVEVTDIRKLAEKYDATNTVSKRLCLAAVGMVGFADRVERFAGADGYGKLLKDSILAADVEAVVLSWTVNSRDDFEVSAGSKTDKAKLLELSEQIESSDKFVRYAAIDRLFEDGSDEAIEVLFGDEEKGFGARRQTVNRRLRAIGRSSYPDAAMELANRIETCRRPANAHQVMITLMDMTGFEPRGDGALPFRNTDYQRRSCSAWWKSKVDSWSPASRVATDTLESAEAVQRRNNERVLSVIASFVKASAIQLEGMSRPDALDEDDNFKLRIGGISAGDDLAGTLLENLKQLIFEVETFARFSGKDQGEVDADVVAIKRRVRLACCDTTMQKLAVELNACAEFLAIAASNQDEKGAFAEAIGNVQKEMQADLSASGDVVDEVFYGGYYCVRFFDIILRITERDGK